MTALTALVTARRPGVSFYVDHSSNTKAFAAHRSTFATQGQNTNARAITLLTNE
jgi:hypothetical protein